MEALPTLEQHWIPEPSPTVSLALLECFTVLEGLLSTVQATSALFHYCQQPSLPIQQILLAIPLPPPPPTTATTASPLIPHSPRHRLHIQLSRLVTALSISIGPSRTEEYLLPSINAFLGSFNDLYGSEEDGTIGTSLDLAGAEGGQEEGLHENEPVELWENPAVEQEYVVNHCSCCCSLLLCWLLASGR
jgi:hypothetical protein